MIIIIYHFIWALIYPPSFDKFKGSWCAHEHHKDEDTLKGIDDVEHGRWSVDVEGNNFENPIYCHDRREECCALHSGIIHKKK